MSVSLRNILFAAVLIAAPTGVADARPDAKVASGETQVVARAAGREITLTELRLEMARLGLPLTDPASERTALQSLINRTVLSMAARDADLHRRADAITAMRAAQDQALADLYLGTVAQPAEPTPQEIDEFIRAHPSVFAERRFYEFLVLTMPSDAFDEDKVTPLFDEEPDFSRLVDALKRADVEYSLANAAQPATAFPEPIREQLARYAVADNIVIRGEAKTQVMKITAARRDATASSQWPALARRMILEEESAARASAVLERLKTEAAVAYYRKSSAPAAAAKPQ